MTGGVVWGTDRDWCQPPGFKSQPCHFLLCGPGENSGSSLASVSLCRLTLSPSRFPGLGVCPGVSP